MTPTAMCAQVQLICVTFAIVASNQMVATDASVFAMTLSVIHALLMLLSVRTVILDLNC